jgi:nucleoside-diphosphate kinase
MRKSQSTWHPRRRTSYSSRSGGRRRASTSAKIIRAAGVTGSTSPCKFHLQRGLVGEIITRFERKGFQLKGLKLYQTPREVAEEHYKDLKSKPFYNDLVDYILSGPVVCMVWGGHGVVKSARSLIGATNPLESAPGTIRGDFAVEVGRNVIHGSDSDDNGKRETALWFDDDEIIAWTPHMTPWLREEGRF